MCVKQRFFANGNNNDQIFGGVVCIKSTCSLARRTKVTRHIKAKSEVLFSRHAAIRSSLQHFSKRASNPFFFGSLWNATVRPVDEERVSVEEFRDYAECISIVKCQNLKRVSFGLILLKKWQENSAWLSGTKNRIWEKLFR